MKLSAKEIQAKLQHFGGITHDLRETEAFLRFAAKLPPNSTILETCTCWGKSACSWVLATNGHIWTMEKEPIRVSVSQNNINSVGLQDHINVICCDSERYPWKRQVDVVWLDSDHTPDHLLIELKKYTPFAKHLVCGHDYGHPEFPGVQMMVDNYFGDIDVDGTIWYRWIND